MPCFSGTYSTSSGAYKVVWQPFGRACKVESGVCVAGKNFFRCSSRDYYSLGVEWARQQDESRIGEERKGFSVQQLVLMLVVYNRPFDAAECEY